MESPPVPQSQRLVPRTFNTRCPVCGSPTELLGFVSTEHKCSKCGWIGPELDTYPKEGQEVHDCLSCGETTVVLPHICLKANPPVLQKRIVKEPLVELEVQGPVRTETFQPAVGDTQSEEKGSGARFNNDKVPYDYIPLHLLAEAAEVFHLVTTRKINPYPRWNWLKGMPWLVPYACLIRHLAAWFLGEDRDVGPGGSGKRHSAHMLCNILMIIHYEQTYPEGDNRPSKWFNLTKED